MVNNCNYIYWRKPKKGQRCNRLCFKEKCSRHMEHKMRKARDNYHKKANKVHGPESETNVTLTGCNVRNRSGSSKKKNNFTCEHCNKSDFDNEYHYINHRKKYHNCEENDIYQVQYGFIKTT